MKVGKVVVCDSDIKSNLASYDLSLAGESSFHSVLQEIPVEVTLVYFIRR